MYFTPISDGKKGLVDGATNLPLYLVPKKISLKVARGISLIFHKSSDIMVKHLGFWLII